MDVLQILIAIVIAFVIYVSLASILRRFWVKLDKPADLEMQDVDINFECTICGTKVTMTMKPEGEVPEAPRHCKEDMVLSTNL